METSKKTGKRRKPSVESPEIARVGKDEMNLAEFPTAILTNRPNDGIKTLRFRDSHGQLTVTGSDALGLPMPVDADVLVALIEMTKQKNNFTEAKVNFTRYELIRLIGWSNVGSSYKRLKESLDRWAGVLLIYDGCWWDNRIKQYISKTVHIIEDIVIAEGRTNSEKDGRQQSLPLSSFSWSSHFMDSFDANNLKSLDTAFYFSLDLPTSKQLFRFLDKRFGNNHPKWTFNLDALAFEHVGLNRNYTPAKIKEKLSGAIEELENKGFLKPLPRDERYFKAGDTWKICLIDGRIPPLSLPQTTPEPESQPVIPPLAGELITRGVKDKVAAELVKNHPAEFISQQIEAFDWLVAKKDKKIKTSPVGYLVKSITDAYDTPKQFISTAKQLEAKKAREVMEAADAEKRRIKREAEAKETQERSAIDAYWSALTPEEQAELQATADAMGKPEDLALEIGPLKSMGQHIRREAHIRQLLNEQKSTIFDA